MRGHTYNMHYTHNVHTTHSTPHTPHTLQTTLETQHTHLSLVGSVDDFIVHISHAHGHKHSSVEKIRHDAVDDVEADVGACVPEVRVVVHCRTTDVPRNDIVVVVTVETGEAL